MPLIGLMHLVIGVGFAVHAMRTGRPQYWMYILLFVPLIGSIAYVLLELLPEMAQTRRAQKVKGDVADLIHPHREFNRRIEAARVDTVETKLALAEECERKGMWDEAIRLYQAAAQGIYASDGQLLTGLARAQLNCGDAPAAIDTLNRLRAADPDGSYPEAHLIYARCLEDLGRLTEAEAEFQAIAAYYVGLEARTRYALLLVRNGNVAKARPLFEEVVRASNARGVVITDADRDWLKVAKANL
ncbi:MAG: tetratricopeptide repeat protein [Hyphomicrobium sp.]